MALRYGFKILVGPTIWFFEPIWPYDTVFLNLFGSTVWFSEPIWPYDMVFSKPICPYDMVFKTYLALRYHLTDLFSPTIWFQKPIWPLEGVLSSCCLEFFLRRCNGIAFSELHRETSKGFRSVA